jgi:tetratricopeptide (TPR) repeat protein
MATVLFAMAARRHLDRKPRQAAHLLREAVARLPELGGDAEYAIKGTGVRLPIPENTAWARAYAALSREVRWGDDETFEWIIETALKFDPKYAEPYFLRAKRITGGPVPPQVLDRAVKDLDKAIQLDSNDARFFELRASLRSRPYYPFLDQAIADYTRALEIEPRNEQFLMDRAEVLIRRKRPAAAIHDFTRVIERWNPPGSVSAFSWGPIGNVHRALSGRASCLQELKKFRDAVEDWTRLIDGGGSSSNGPEYLEQRAECFRQLGQARKAAADSKRAKELKTRRDERRANRTHRS